MNKEMDEDKKDDALIDRLKGTEIGGWTLERSLGKGASAVVFKGHKGNQDAAIKVYKPDMVRKYGENNEIDRITRQTKLIGTKHPHLISIFDGGQDSNQGDLYLVMEFLEGKSLDRWRKDVPVDRIGPLIAQIASAAEYLEKKHGLAHRDIKPANVVVDEHYRKATLLDLGVVGPLGDSVPKSGGKITGKEFLGTVLYSPPEFFLGEEEGTKCGYRAITFYQLGAVLHDLLTGKPMFSDAERSTDANWYKKLENENPDLSCAKLRPGVDPSLVDLAKKCLEKDWHKRLKAVKWNSFRCTRLVRRPTVIMLYTGGTIGAHVDDTSSRQRGLRTLDSPGHELVQVFQRRIVRDFTQLHGTRAQMPVDLIWQVLPPEQQLLSENAGPDTWNNLATAVEDICRKHVCLSDPPPQTSPVENAEIICAERKTRSGTSRQDSSDVVWGRYILGVVVFHGTDTLAYSAAAFSLQNLPFPIVLTGSNQPPNETSMHEQNLVISESDAWKNIRRSLLFLHMFGHRFTEVFVCFGETIHQAINLRKTAIDQIPLLDETEHRSIEEPYVYRNRGTQRQYMYRHIDGLYCNNFYPVQGQFTYKDLQQDVNYRHARRSPLVTHQEIHRSRFSSAVKMVMVSPAFWFEGGGRVVNAEEISKAINQDLKVLVVEGYHSGTFPTREGHPFTSLLKVLLRESIPIVLISRSGLVPSREFYKTEKVDGQEIPVLRLFGIIAETAVPLVSLVFADIPELEWMQKSDESPAELLGRRLKLLENGIRNWQRTRPNILNDVLGSIVDQTSQSQWLSKEAERDRSDYRRLVQSLITFGRSDLRPLLPHASESQGSLNLTTTFPRPDFLLALMELMRPYEVGRCGPDGFSVINEMGFEWGRRVLDALVTARPREDKDLLELKKEQDIGKLINHSKSFVKCIVRRLRQSGIANIVDAPITVIPPGDPNEICDGLMSLEIKVMKQGWPVRSDELYAVIGHRDSEEDLFRQLREGCDLTWYDKEMTERLEDLYQNLFTTNWEARPCPLDWFITGVFLAILCGLLRYLMFDKWVQYCDTEDIKYANALRQSITTKIIVADKNILRVRFEYGARGIVPMSGEVQAREDLCE